MTPPSVRYLGRRVYLGAVVLVAAMIGGVTRGPGGAAAAGLGVSVRMLARWRVWWRETFVASTF